MKFLFILFFVLITAYSQICGETIAKKPELGIKVLPEKEIYRVNESLVLTIEFTNLTDQILCFPKPDRDCVVTGTGSLIVTNDPVSGGEDLFMCYMDSRSPNEDELLNDIEHHWTKIAPNGTLIVKSTTTNFKAPGQWRISAKYTPPVGAFSRTYREFLQSGADKFGCQLPGSTIHSSAVVTVVPATDEK